MRTYVLASEFLRPCLERLLQAPDAPGLLTLPFPAAGQVAAALEALPSDCGELLAPEGAALLGEGPLAVPVPLVLPKVHNGAALFSGAAAYRQLYGQGVLCWALPGWERPVLFGPAGDCRGLCLLADTRLGLPDGELAARAAAQAQGWDFLQREADYSLLEGLLAGTLPKEAVVRLAPGQRLARSYGRDLLEAI